MVVVDSGKCDGCGGCVIICPNDVFQILGEKSDPSLGGKCVFCESCTGVCPTEAITVSDR